MAKYLIFILLMYSSAVNSAKLFTLGVQADNLKLMLSNTVFIIK